MRKILFMFAFVWLGMASVFTYAADLRFTRVWIKPSAPGVSSYAAYFDIENTGKNLATIENISADRCAVAMLHQTHIEQGRATMVMLDVLNIPAGERISLVPGAMHLMLMQCDQPLTLGDQLQLSVELVDGAVYQFAAQVNAE